jgi:hypothetical protein
VKTPFHPGATALALALALSAAGCFSSGGSCETSALCEAGSFCLDGRCVARLPAGSCTPPGSPALSAGGVSSTALEPAPGACLRVVASSVLPPGWIVFDGDRGVGQTVAFTIPPGSTSLAIHSQATSAAATFSFAGYSSPIPNIVAPTAVKAPNGQLLYDDMIAPPMDPRLLDAYYVGLTPWTGSFGLPSSWRLADLSMARGELPSGGWSFEVNDWNAECALVSGCSPGSSSPAPSYHVTVVAKPGPFVSTGTLDLNIYLVGGAPGLTAANAQSYPGMTRYIAEINRLLGQAGICLGQVTFREVPAWARTDLRFTEPNIDGSTPCGELFQLFTLAAPVDGVHLFLVDALCVGTSCNSGIVGIDGSIPGPSGLPGAHTSGAAMTLDDLGTAAVAGCGAAVNLATCGPDRAGSIAAHEIGHWLGLYHTTEAGGDLFDPLPDTGTCGCGDCAPSSEILFCGHPNPSLATRMIPAWCAASGATCSGGDNLMFWVIDPHASIGRLTAQQALVARLNPAVK